MNSSRLYDMLDEYCNNFDEINNDEHKEYYKWEAIKHFQDNWDVDNKDFVSMLEESTKVTSNLINNRYVQPNNGLLTIAKKSNFYKEAIRQLFKDLYALDDGDLVARFNRLSNFIAKSNKLVAECMPKSWKMEQNMASAVFYLNLRYPDENYIYKPKQAREFMDYTHYSDDFGTGVNFDLRKYYKMCDQIVEAIKNHPTLLDMHKARMTATMYGDEKYHVLAYDIIYSAMTYKLYNNLGFEVGLTKKQRIIRRTTETIQGGLQNKQDEFNALFAEYDKIKDFSASGVTVQHVKYGEGTILSNDSEFLNILFSDGEKKITAAAFNKGFISTKREDVIDMINNIIELKKQIDVLENKIKIEEKELEKYV